MLKNEIYIPILRHGQFDGPGASDRSFTNFVSSLSEASKSYPLTEMGRSQVKEAMRQIPGYKQIDLVLTSEFLRTQQSAQVISGEVAMETGRQVEVISSPLLNMVWMPPNSLSETEYEELQRTGRKNAIADEMFQRWTDGHGESPKMVEERIEKFFSFLKTVVEEKSPSKPIVITHASFASALQRYVQGLSLVSPRNEEQILKVAGYYFLIAKGDLVKGNFSIDLLKEKYLAQFS